MVGTRHFSAVPDPHWLVPGSPADLAPPRFKLGDYVQTPDDTYGVVTYSKYRGRLVDYEVSRAGLHHRWFEESQLRPRTKKVTLTEERDRMAVLVDAFVASNSTEVPVVEGSFMLIPQEARVALENSARYILQRR